MDDVRRMADIRVRDLLLMTLTFSSGAIDAINYLAMGKVFTAFMTGNIVSLRFTTHRRHPGARHCGARYGRDRGGNEGIGALKRQVSIASGNTIDMKRG